LKALKSLNAVQRFFPHVGITRNINKVLNKTKFQNEEQASKRLVLEESSDGQMTSLKDTNTNKNSNKSFALFSTI